MTVGSSAWSQKIMMAAGAALEEMVATWRGRSCGSCTDCGSSRQAETHTSRSRQLLDSEKQTRKALGRRSSGYPERERESHSGTMVQGNRAT